MEAVLFGLLGLLVGGVTIYIYSEKRARGRGSALQEKVGQLEAALTEVQTKYQLVVKERAEKELENKATQAEVVKLKEKIAELTSTNTMLNQSKSEQATANQIKVADLEKDRTQLRAERDALAKELTALKQHEPIRLAEHHKMVLGVNQLRESLEADRAKDLATKKAEEEERLRIERETWLRHETEVEEKMRLLCQQLGIEYVDKEKFPFSGKPDNCVKICDEYIIFDSKSPQGEDLSNFPSYIKAQAEAAKKYAKHEGVKKDIHLVVPNNAIGEIPETFISLGTYRVHVITIDSVSAILLALKKIEDYEFAEKLSPEDRETIVTMLGKFAHRAKRRLQIDCYLNTDLLSLLLEAEKLPEDILKGAQEVERTLKLNPAIQKRAKRIEYSALKKETTKLEGKVLGQEINLGDELAVINAIPLDSKAKIVSE